MCPEAISAYLKQIADDFLKDAKQSDDFSLDTPDYKTETIEGKQFSGEVVIFSIEGGMYQTIFMLSDGDGIWNGQYTGTKEGWTDAVNILKALKKN